MINFSPEITIEVASVVSVCCSIFCTILFYYWYSRSKKDRGQILSQKIAINELSNAFVDLTNAIMERVENEDFGQCNDDDNSRNIDSSSLSLPGLRDTRTSGTKVYTEGKDNNRERMPTVHTDL